MKKNIKRDSNQGSNIEPKPNQSEVRVFSPRQQKKTTVGNGCRFLLCFSAFYF